MGKYDRNAPTTTIQRLRLAQERGDQKEVARLTELARQEITRWAKDAKTRAPVRTRE